MIEISKIEKFLEEGGFVKNLLRRLSKDVLYKVGLIKVFVEIKFFKVDYREKYFLMASMEKKILALL